MKFVIMIIAGLTATTSYVVVQSGMFEENTAISQTNTQIYKRVEVDGNAV